MYSHLNLVTPGRPSEIVYIKSKFPDGQQQITINSDSVPPWPKQPALITTRLTSFGDLELLLAATASLRECGFPEINVDISYFLGARSDRKFQEGGNNYLKTVICPIINAQNYGTVTVFEPHSDVLEGCLNNFSKVDSSGFVKAIVRNCLKEGNINDFTLVCPDSGFLKKMYGIVEKLGYEGTVVICSKYRKLNGQLTNIHVPLEDNLSKPLLILDDICDGGRTFIELAKIIHDKHPDFKENMYLGVSHGIFSNGFKELNEAFTKVYCTNSFKTLDFVTAKHYDMPIKGVTQFDLFNNFLEI